ncbi:MAG: DMT family transporter [Anaerolineales bacterium]|nr:DMT family transporter [Anaerolineales bacterium]
MKEVQHQPLIPPLLAIAFAILAVSTASILIRYAQADAPSLVIAAYRLAIAGIILAPIALKNYKEELKVLSKRSLFLAMLSGFFLAIHFATWITSLEYTTVASSVVLVSTAPIWVALLAPFTIRESLTKPILIGMSLTLIGGLVIGISDSCNLIGNQFFCPSLAEFVSGEAFLGDFLALVGALAAAFYLLIGRSVRRNLSLVPYVFLVYSMAAIALVLFTLLASEPLFGYAPRTYLWFVLLALFPQLIGHSTYNWALKYLSAAYVSISLLGEPIGTTILAYFLLKETPSSIKIIGAILILIGILIASKREKLLSEPVG